MVFKSLKETGSGQMPKKAREQRRKDYGLFLKSLKLDRPKGLMGGISYKELYIDLASCSFVDIIQSGRNLRATEVIASS